MTGKRKRYLLRSDGPVASTESTKRARYLLRSDGPAAEVSLDDKRRARKPAAKRIAPDVECALCRSNTPACRTRLACGGVACRNRVCLSCLHTWYRQEQGEIVTEARWRCPCCKSPPSSALLRSLVGGLPAGLKALYGNWDAKTVYGWCDGCNRIKPTSLRRVCSEDDESPLDLPRTASGEFWCDDCVAVPPMLRKAPDAPIDVQMCPSCTIMTWRFTGCPHMDCTFCNQSWCWDCGQLCEMTYRGYVCGCRR